MSRQVQMGKSGTMIITSKVNNNVPQILTSSENMDVSSNPRLVEMELVRQRLYISIVKKITRWLSENQSRLPWSETQISHLLLRYIFNKNATNTQLLPDPVFIIGESSMARRQLDRDLRSIHLNNAMELAHIIDDELEHAATEMSRTNIDYDQPVTMSVESKSKLIYRGTLQEDFAQLGKRYGPDYYRPAYALGLRYTYLHLAAHGLSRAYKDETKLPQNDRHACECFASAFNHYFDKYYSAFPDLEKFFGSRGSFFQANLTREPQDMTYYVNPPFDESLMELAVDRVLELLKTSSVSEARFIFTVPGTWTDFKALEKLKKSSWTKKIKDYPKGKLPFIDYMATDGNGIIYPTDICEVTLENKHEDEFYS